MTTPTPLDQQRQLVRDFVAASKQRSQRETTAQQQYASGEKAAKEQFSTTERVAQQQYTTTVKNQEDSGRAQQSILKQAADKIGSEHRFARAHLEALGVPISDLPPTLGEVDQHPPADRSDDPVAAFTTSAGRIQQLGASAGRLVEARNRQQARQRKLLIGAAVVMVILAVAGYFYYQRWSYDQRLAGIYQAGVAALNEENWPVARNRFNELLRLEPGYQDAQELLAESYYRPGRAAFETGDWQGTQEQLNELLRLVPGYQDAQALLYESYYLAGKTAFDVSDWQEGLAPLSELLRMQPDHAEARALINEHAEEIGAVTNPRDETVYLPVPAGEFLMGSPDGVGDDDEHPQHTVYLDAFWIMQTEVTNAQYARCVAAGACSAPDNSVWQDSGYAEHPVTGVTWYQASEYAAWAGGRLPTEAEWEKAARGTDGRTYPWGEDAPAASLVNCCGFVNETMPVGSYPAGASPYGALDMAGNVWEWTADRYAGGYYSQSPAQNPTGPGSGDFRVLRGGSWVDFDNGVRSALRIGDDPGRWFNLVGFRCVRSQ